MLNKVTCYLLIICFCGSQLSKLFIYVNFSINQDVIADTLCVKKDVPSSSCKGKCYLAEQLKKQEAKDKKQLSLDRKQTHPLDFYRDNKKSYLCFDDLLFQNKKVLSKYLDFNIQEFIVDVFHPPRII